MEGKLSYRKCKILALQNFPEAVYKCFVDFHVRDNVYIYIYIYIYCVHILCNINVFYSRSIQIV